MGACVHGMGACVHGMGACMHGMGACMHGMDACVHGMGVVCVYCLCAWNYTWMSVCMDLCTCTCM